MTTATAPQLTMDSDHRYRIGGVEIPSVTQVINSVLPGWKADEYFLTRGSAMHAGCELMDAGTLDWSSVAPEIEGRLRAWQKFREEYPATVAACEVPLSHQLYRFAGTLDRVFVEPYAHVIGDIKSSIAPQVVIQLGAYSLLWEARGNAKISRGVAIELTDAGTYRTKWFTRRELEHGGRIFLACLSIHSFKLREKIS